MVNFTVVPIIPNVNLPNENRGIYTFENLDLLSIFEV